MFYRPMRLIAITHYDPYDCSIYSAKFFGYGPSQLSAHFHPVHPAASQLQYPQLRLVYSLAVGLQRS